jgi:hypothetical protein
MCPKKLSGQVIGQQYHVPKFFCEVLKNLGVSYLGSRKLSDDTLSSPSNWLRGRKSVRLLGHGGSRVALHGGRWARHGERGRERRAADRWFLSIQLFFVIRSEFKLRAVDCKAIPPPSSLRAPVCYVYTTPWPIVTSVVSIRKYVRDDNTYRTHQTQSICRSGVANMIWWCACAHADATPRAEQAIGQ